MDVISLGKAMKTIRDTRKLNKEIIGQEAESHFKTVDHRLDWIEGQADKIIVNRSDILDISEGEFQNLEYSEGKLKLLAVGELIGEGTTNLALNATSNSSTFNRIFDGDMATSAGISLNSNFTFQTETKFIPTRLVLKVRVTFPNSGQGFRFHGYNEDTKEWDELTRFAVGLVPEPKIGIDTDTAYSQFKVEHGGSPNYTYSGSIYELELYSLENKILYASQGTWTSPIIDLGIGWKETKALNVIKQETESANILLEVATSSDGMSFTDYETLTEEELPQARYLKIRATLSAQPIGDGEEVVYLFDQSTEENIVTLNKYVEANGQLKLKQDYNDLMSKDLSWVDEGSLHRKVVTRGEWKKIDSISIG